MTQNAVEIAHFGRQKRGGGYEIKDFRGAIKREGARLPAAKSPRRRASPGCAGCCAGIRAEYLRMFCGNAQNVGILQNCRPKLSESCGKS